MELLVTGTPGLLLSSVIALVEAVAELDGHSTRHLTIDDQNTWVGPQSQSCDGLCLYEVRAPRGTIAQGIEDGHLRAMLVIDDPASCMAVLIRAGHSPQEAARALSAAASPLGALVGLDTVTVLTPDMALAEAVEAIRRGIGHNPSGAEQTVLSQRFAARDSGAPLASLASPERARSSSGLSDEAQALVDEVITPMFQIAASGRRQKITWSRAGLFWGDRPGEPLPRIIDLTGPARVLAYGPYFYLPAGGWTVRAVLAFSPAAVGAPMAVELHGDGLLGRGRLSPKQAGVFAASFPADVRSPHVPIEVRVVSEAGAIDGEIGVDHLALVPRE